MTEAERLAEIIGSYRSPYCGAAAAELRRLSAELDEVRADRDSWAQQASDRAGEAVAAIEELEALKKAISEAQPVAQWLTDTEDGVPMFDVDAPTSYELSLGWEPLYTLKGIK